MAPTYKLTYFDARGVAEPLRMLFKYGGIQFEDVRIKHEEWPTMKPDTPFGQLPILEINGNKFNQSLALTRYIAQQVKLAGKNDLEDLEINAIVDTLSDLRQKIVMFIRETDEKLKEEKKTVLFNETMPFYLERLDAIAKKNNGHLAVGRLTWADFYLSSWYDRIITMHPELAKKYPNVATVVNNVNEVPSIKAWIAERPVTEF